MMVQSVDDVVARAIEARGGMDRIKTERTQRITGKISLASDSGQLVVEFKRPGKMREMVTLNGEPHVRTTEGNVPEMAGSADFEGPLVDYKAKGNKIELAGQEEVGDRMAYKLVISMKNGENRVDFVDAKSYLELKWEGKVGDNVFESYFSDYRKVDGLMFAFTIDSGLKGQPSNQKIMLEKVEVNPPIDDARFQKP